MKLYIKTESKKKSFHQKNIRKIIIKKNSRVWSVSSLGGKWSEIFMMRMLYLKDGREDVRMWVFGVQWGPSCRKMETFLVSNLCHIEGFCVTAERLEEEKDETHSHHNSTSRVLGCVPGERKSSSFSSFSDNDSDTEIDGKANFPVCDPQTNTRTHTSAVHRALHKYWKKIWNNKNIRCLILISSYFSLRRATGGSEQRVVGGILFPFFCQCVYFSFCRRIKSWGERWNERYFNFLCS